MAADIEVQEGTHAVLSASGSERWSECPGAPAMESVFPRSSSRDADEGTAAHELAKIVFSTEDRKAEQFLGMGIKVGERMFEADDDMTGYVQKYVDSVLNYANGCEVLVEQQVSIESITGEPGGIGTSDAVVVNAAAREIQIHDLKYGRGVPVLAENNKQLLIYAAGTLATLDYLVSMDDIDEVLLVIHQVRLRGPSEWRLSKAEFLQRVEELRVRAKAARRLYLLRNEPAQIEPNLRPGDEQCRWCKAKAVCPALAKHVADQVGASFEELPVMALAVEGDADKAKTDPAQAGNTDLNTKMLAVDLVEQWCKAVRAETERRLLAGEGDGLDWKLVQGRKGNRAWDDEAEVEAACKSLRLKSDEMYNRKLKTPPQIEKVLKDSPRKWAKLAGKIVQPDGKLSVAHVSDERPAVSVAAAEDDFEDLTDATNDDLL